MKIKELEYFLSQCNDFSNPKVNLEQYRTSSHIAARMLYSAQEYIQGSSVCDLGSGCGILSIGSILCNASYVVGIDVDSDAMNDALVNVNELLEENQSSLLQFIQMKISKETVHSLKFKGFFDVVIMNPPFGTKGNEGADVLFLKSAASLIQNNGRIYSLHKTSTRNFFFKKIPELGLVGKVLAEVVFDLPKSYKFHKEKTKDIHVDFWEYQKSST